MANKNAMIAIIESLRNKGLSYRKIAEQFNITRSTVARLSNETKQ